MRKERVVEEGRGWGGVRKGEAGANARKVVIRCEQTKPLSFVRHEVIVQGCVDPFVSEPSMDEGDGGCGEAHPRSCEMVEIRTIQRRRNVYEIGVEQV
jgi:hypothetical protein